MAGFVAYYRVFTARQGQSGLGLDAQRSAVAGRDELMAEFTEVESSRKNDRPQLAAALGRAVLAEAPARERAGVRARALRSEGASLRRIAAALKMEGMLGPCGGTWGPSSVRLLLLRSSCP